MILLEAFQIKKYFGDRLIFELPTLKIYTGNRIGIVGANGVGKTTLMNLLSGEIGMESGSCKRYCNIAYIRQFSEEIVDVDKKMIGEFSLGGKLHRENLSGGEQTRLKIANALTKESVLLFADEPTANLDYKGIHLLEQKLLKQESFVIISHDRALLDRLCNKILEIKDEKVQLYDGNYSFYFEKTQAEGLRKKFEYEQYVNERARLIEAIGTVKTKAKSVKKAPKRMGNSEARLHRREATEAEQKINNAAKAIKSRIDHLEIKDKPREVPKMKLDFLLTNPPENKMMITGKDIHFSYDKNTLFDGACFEVKNHRKLAIIGENGVGKTTLLNLIVSGYEGIYRVPKAKIGYLRQRFENLDFTKTVLDNIMADSIQSEKVVRNLLARLLFKGEEVYKKVNVLSGGEKIKLSLGKLLVGEYNILFLDEPTNYLDIPSMEAVQHLLQEYEGTLLFVSHDKTFINAVADGLLVVKNKKIISFDGDLVAFEKENTIERNRLYSQEKLLLEIQLTKVLSDLSLKNADKEVLEMEYQSILKKIKN